TDMSTPLGYAVGNAVEVAESVEVLAGGGPPDVVELTLTLAREMLDAAGLPDADPAAALADGRAMDAWRALITAQGGDPDATLPHRRGARGGRRRGGDRSHRENPRSAGVGADSLTGCLRSGAAKSSATPPGSGSPSARTRCRSARCRSRPA